MTGPYKEPYAILDCGSPFVNAVVTCRRRLFLLSVWIVIFCLGRLDPDAAPNGVER
ncbi:MAG: hypothetical protein KDJ37_15525 [Hyphomicrobiaceae bacterium]|nr:hypothetical protein [Hyphomicrobiaceae bacterium]